MHWSLNSMEEQTFGQLLAAFRRRRGLSQQDVAPLLARFGFRFAPQLSLLEGGTWPTHPDRALIGEFARLYTLSPFEESFLLRQADILPSATEQQSLLMRFGTTLLDFSSPACVVNAHWQLVAWNETFAALYDGSESLGAPSSRFHQQPGSALPESTVPESTLRAALHAPQVTLGDVLTLQDNLNFLVWLFSRRSRVRALVEADEWQKLAQFFLIRFWRTSLPLLNHHWYSPAEPAWILRLEDEMQALNFPDNQEFAELSTGIRRSLEADAGWADPHSQLINNFLQDRLLFRQLGLQFQVIPTSMSDARFLFLEFQQTAAPELLVQTLRNMI